MDYREEIFYALAHAECPMMASAKYVSLEDIFLELTEEHPDTRSKKSKRRFLSKRQKEEETWEIPADPENMEALETTRENTQEVEDHGSNL